MIIYDVMLELHVTGGSDRSSHFQQVSDEYCRLEEADPRLLDSAFSFADSDEHAEVEVELTINADTEDEAYQIASDCVRTAIHAAGGFTPNWGERVHDDAPVYRVTEESVEVMPA